MKTILFSVAGLMLLLNNSFICNEALEKQTEECAGMIKYASESQWISDMTNKRFLSEPQIDSSFVLQSVKTYSSNKLETYYNFYYVQDSTGVEVSNLHECHGEFLGSNDSGDPSENMVDLFDLEYAGVVQF